MVTLRWTTDERDAVTLVELVVENSTETPVRIRIGNRLDGEVWPPRSEGVPDAGWDDGGFEGVVGAGERLSLGYASPSIPTDTPNTQKQPESDEPPAEIVWTERAAEPRPRTQPGGFGLDGRDVSMTIEPTATGVVRALGDSRPPADAVPLPNRPELPDAVKTWLSAVETRIEQYEMWEDTTVERREEKRELVRQIGDDEEKLRAVAKRVDDAREHIESVRADESVGSEP